MICWFFTKMPDPELLSKSYIHADVLNLYIAEFQIQMDYSINHRNIYIETEG